jgi:hypothetical protein
MTRVDRPFQIGDSVSVVRLPPNVESPDCPFPEVRRAFEGALGKVYSIDAVDWGGWVFLRIGRGEGIGVQPDCFELVSSQSNLQ